MAKSVCHPDGLKPAANRRNAESFMEMPMGGPPFLIGIQRPSQERQIEFASNTGKLVARFARCDTSP